MIGPVANPKLHWQNAGMKICQPAIIFGGACLILIALCLCNDLSVRGQTSKGQRTEKTAGSGQNRSAKMLFNKSCLKCHGSDGRGQTVAGQIAGAPDFTDRRWQEDVSDGRLVTSITHGRGGMPSFEKKLTAGQIGSLVAYVRAFKK